MRRKQSAAAGNASGVALRRFIRENQEAQSVAGGAISQSRPRTDPQHQAGASQYSFNLTGRLLEGTITDSTAVANCYRVQFEKGCATMPCYFMPRTSQMAVGIRELGGLQPGTKVHVIVHSTLNYGTILGVAPTPSTRTDLAISQLIACATRNRVDEAHKWPMRSAGGGNVTDWNWGRAFDAIHAGEQGYISDTGIRIFIDSCMAQLAVDEACGIFAFGGDQLLRVAAYNLQLWTAGSERDAFNDQEEIYDVEGFTPYPWEQLGRFANQDPRRELPPAAWQQNANTPFYSKWEPVDDWQMPWHRHRYFRGYLGQGGKTLVVGMPKDASENKYTRYDGDGGHAGDQSTTSGDGESVAGAEHPALFDQTIGLDGRWTVQTAKGFSLVKRLGNVSPTRMRRPEQPGDDKGDTPANYKFGGVLGEGPEHVITGDLAVDSDVPELQRASGVLDLHAYLFNYAGVHPFHYHAHDWKLPQESELAWTDGVSNNVQGLDFSQLRDKFSLPAPEPVKLKIDHRYGEQNYYPNEAGFAVLEDGGLVFFDGYGAELRMTGGRISLISAGDIEILPGRDLNLWAGHDIILRAKNSVDISATEHDVRLKAEQHIQIVGGNSGTGAVLLECKAAGASYDFSQQGEAAVAGGIIFKAGQSDIVGLAENIYFRTGGGSIAAGDIILDAGAGSNDVVIHAQNVNEFLGSAHQQFFGSNGNVTSANIFASTFCSISTELAINGAAIIDGDIIGHGWLQLANGHIATELAEGFSFEVAPLTGIGLNRVYETLAQEQQLSTQTLPQAGNTFYQLELEELAYATNKPGNALTIDQIAFSFRSLTQYRTEDFRMYEARWQQLARLTDQSPATWTEKAVTWQGQDTWPYPGPKLAEAIYYEQALTIFDPKTGCAKDRGTAGQAPDDVYANPKYGQVTPKTLNGNYPIIG